MPSLLKGLQRGRCCPRTGSVDVTADFGVEDWTEADPDGEFLRRAVQSERINSMPQSSHGPMDEQEPNTQPRVAHPRTAKDIPYPSPSKSQMELYAWFGLVTWGRRLTCRCVALGARQADFAEP